MGAGSARDFLLQTAPMVLFPYYNARSVNPLLAALSPRAPTRFAVTPPRMIFDVPVTRLELAA